MRRLRTGRTSPALVVAAVALALTVSPLAYGAAKAVGHAFFADNAGKVDGLRASKKPKPGRLLALNTKGKFPSKVVPAGPLGPAGDKGDKGDPGDQGVPGEAGAPGAAGLDGAPVATRARATTPPGGSASGPIPLTGNGWTQAVDETNLIFGSIRVTTSGCDPGLVAFYAAQLSVDGVIVANAQTFANGTHTLVFTPIYPVMESGGSAGHTLTVNGLNLCSTATLEDLRITVAKFR